MNLAPLVLRKLMPLLLLGSLLAAQATLAAEIDDRLVAAESLYRTQGPEAALPEFERLAQSLRASGDERGHAIALGLVGECHWRLGNFDAAEPVLNQALALKRRLGDRPQEARTLNVLGLLAWHRGQYPEAIERFEATAAIARELHDAKLEAAVLNNLSLVGDELGDYHASLERYQQALALFRSIDFPRGEGDVLGNIGGVNLLLGRFHEAETYYRQALAISERLESTTSLGQDHGNLALSLLGQGRIDAALGHFDKAAEYAAAAGMRRDQAYWQRGKANALASHGHYDAALELHRSAIATYADIGADPERVEALHDAGAVYLLLGDAGSARRSFDESLELARSIGLARAVTASLIASGDLELRQSNESEAARLYGQALERAREAGEMAAWTESLLRLATAARDAADESAAAPPASPVESFAARDPVLFARRALEIARETGARRHEAEALLLLADLGRTADAAAALNTYAEAQSLAEATGDPELRWQIHYGRARTLIEQGALAPAETELLAALVIIESVRERLYEQRFRSGYLQDKMQVYVELARLQLRLGRTADAFSTAERLRASSYLTLVERRVAEPGQGSGTAREIELRERIRQLQQSLGDEATREQPERRDRAIVAFSAELAVAEREYEALLDDRRRSPGRFGVLAAPVTYDSLRAQLASDEAVVEYLVDGDAVIAFVVAADSLRAETIDVPVRDLTARVELLRDLVSRPGNDLWTKPAARLADALTHVLGSNDSLRSIRRLHIVPHGVLNYLPFELLPLGDAMLIDRYTVSYLPSAAVLAIESSAAPAADSMLVVAPARSRLRFAREEADSVDALFQPNSRLLAGSEATETAFRALARNYRNLHLATHGYFNKQNPLLSGLELEADATQDGLLEVHEIMGLELAADLVTLSACQTGLGTGFFDDVPAGDDFVGLTRAFIYAGSASVLATLWEVDDRSTGALMTSFYRHLATANARPDKAQALALAQRELRDRPEFAHPYYWAAFVLVGDTRGHHTSGKPAGEKRS